MHETCSHCGLFHPATVPCISLNLPSNEPATGLRAGTLLAGRYEIIRTIHRGGMSTIYLAADAQLNGHEVALKELRLPEGASDGDTREAEAWFARESALLSVLRHPLIPAFYSVFREDGRSYIAQEYVPGENLEDVVNRQGPVEPRLAVSWGMALCQLLAYLHNLPEPVVFRDLKPANILLRQTWSAGEHRLAVVDFGIARPYLRETVGTVIGTPGYAPPEQYQGLSTPQSDVYALGATLHRLLTGYDPEHGTPFTFPSVRSLNPAVSSGLAAVIQRATALNPANRFESATEMFAALQALVPVGERIVQRHRMRMSPLFDGTWMTIAAVLVGVSLLSRMLMFFAAQQDRPYISGSNGSFFAPSGANSQLSAYGQCLSSSTSPTQACGPDGTAWQLNAQGTSLTEVMPDNTRYSYAVPVSSNTMNAVTASSDFDRNLDYVWLTGNTNKVVVFDATGQSHVYTIDGASSVEPVQGGHEGELVFQKPGSLDLQEITPNGSQFSVDSGTFQ